MYIASITLTPAPQLVATEVTLLSDHEKMKPPQRFQNLTREKRSALLKKTVVYGSQNTVKRMSKYVAKKSQLWSNQSMHF